jgi:hypothetical protein
MGGDRTPKPAPLLGLLRRNQPLSGVEIRHGDFDGRG